MRDFRLPSLQLPSLGVIALGFLGLETGIAEVRRHTKAWRQAEGLKVK